MSRRLVLGLGLATALAGCGSDSNPRPTVPEGAGSVVVESELLVPVGSACHVQGTVLNSAEIVSFNVSLRFQSFDANDKVTGATRVDINNLLPGERRRYNATGFAANDVGLIPCSKIARFERIETRITPR
jgi:hypothetical protein